MTLLFIKLSRLSICLEPIKHQESNFHSPEKRALEISPVWSIHQHQISARVSFSCLWSFTETVWCCQAHRWRSLPSAIFPAPFVFMACFDLHSSLHSWGDPLGCNNNSNLVHVPYYPTLQKHSIGFHRQRETRLTGGTTAPSALIWLSEVEGSSDLTQSALSQAHCHM